MILVDNICMLLTVLFSVLENCRSFYPGQNDSTIWKMIDDFQNICVETDLCYSLKNKSGTNGTSCCSPCRCDWNCGRNCCPDKYIASMGGAEFHAAKSSAFECICPQFRAKNMEMFKANSYKMISRCPIGYENEEVQRKCHRDYSEFAENVSDMLPISSTDDNTTFRNYYCSLCHGKHINLIKWTAVLECYDGTLLLIEQLNDILKELATHDECNLFFQAPNNLPFGLETCNDVIDRCNVTGKWLVYDRFLEEACLSYESIYHDPFRDKFFRNMHCLLCNGFDTFPFHEGCFRDSRENRLGSFVALLDFNSLGQKQGSPMIMTNIEECPDGNVFDTFIGMCRELICSKGMVLTSTLNKCIPIIQHMAYERERFITYRITFALEVVDTDRSHYYSRDMIDRLYNDQLVYYDSYYDSEMQREPSKICDFHMYIALKKNTEDVLRDMNNRSSLDFSNDIAYIGVTMKLLTLNPTNSTQLIHDIATVHTRSQYFGGYRVRYRKVNSTILNRIEFLQVNNNNVNMLDQLNVDEVTRMFFLHSFDDPISGKGILPLVNEWFDLYIQFGADEFCVSSATIEPMPLCAKFNIAKGFVTDMDDVCVKVDIAGRQLTFSTFIISITGDSIYVCWDDYFAKMEEAGTDKKDKTITSVTEYVTNVVGYDHLEMRILTIVCISFSLFSLMITLTVYVLFRQLRTLPGLINMGISSSLVISHFLTLINSSVQVTNLKLCMVIGLVLHASLLSSFFWMCVGTFHMTKVFATRTYISNQHSRVRQFVYYLVFVKGMSLTFVGAVFMQSALLQTDDGISTGYGGSPCYIQDPIMVLYCVALPLGFVMLSNLAMFLFVIIKISKMTDMQAHRTTERNKLTIFVKLSTITCGTWIFGFVYQFSAVQLFAYLFIIFNAGQGVFIMFAFVVNQRVYNMLRKKLNAEYELKTINNMPRAKNQPRTDSNHSSCQVIATSHL